MRFLLIRPIEESSTLAKKLAIKGHQALASPVLSIKPADKKNITFSPYQGLVFTSTAAIRVFKDHYGTSKIKIFVVGHKTAKQAKILGFDNILCADGDVEKLAQLIKSSTDATKGPLLYLSAEHISKDLNELLKNEGFQIDRAIIYHAEEQPMLNEHSKNALKNNEIDYIPFYSSRSALIFKAMIKQKNMTETLNKITALSLSANIEKNLSDLPWKKILVAPKPTEDELFKLVGIDL